MNQTEMQLQRLTRYLKELSGVYRTALSHYNIPENEFWIWYSLLLPDEELTQQDLCDIWSLPKQTVNSIVTRMVQKGYVSLAMIPGTRNRKAIHLTAEGRRFGESFVGPIAAAELRAYEKLPVKDRMALSGILTRFLDALRKELSTIE